MTSCQLPTRRGPSARFSPKRILFDAVADDAIIAVSYAFITNVGDLEATVYLADVQAWEAQLSSEACKRSKLLQVPIMPTPHPDTNTGASQQSRL